MSVNSISSESKNDNICLLKSSLLDSENDDFLLLSIYAFTFCILPNKFSIFPLIFLIVRVLEYVISVKL